MKKLKISFVFILFLLLVPFVLSACPRCNQNFYDELLGERGNTLGGQELLEAIRNQQVAGQPSNFILPVSYNNLTDIKEPVNRDTINSTENIGEGKNPSVNNSDYYLYINIIAHLIFPGNLFA